MTEVFPTAPRALRDPAALAQRRALIDPADPLAAYAASLRQGDLEVPDFDPLNGRAGVRLLFLLEKPGPMTAATRQGARPGSGLISPDNDDRTAEATFGFLQTAGVDRSMVAFWNVIPWWNGTIRVTAAEQREGLAALQGLIDLLTGVRGVVLVGNRAGRAQGFLLDAGLFVSRSAHPSPQVRAVYRDMWDAIPAIWATAARACGAVR